MKLDRTLAGRIVKRLDKAVDYVRKTYFPKWDRARSWTIKYSPEHPDVKFCQGKCLKEIKMIYLRVLPDDDVELYRLLIHEICHSFYSGHGKRWQRRMLEVAEQAAKNGDNELSGEIIKEVEEYKNAPIVTARMIYTQVFDAVLDTKGEVPFERIRDYLAGQYGGYDVIDRYKKLKSVYDGAVKNVKEMIRAQAEFTKLLQGYQAPEQGL